MLRYLQWLERGFTHGLDQVGRQQADCSNGNRQQLSKHTTNFNPFNCISARFSELVGYFLVSDKILFIYIYHSAATLLVCCNSNCILMTGKGERLTCPSEKCSSVPVTLPRDGADVLDDDCCTPQVTWTGVSISSLLENTVNIISVSAQNDVFSTCLGPLPPTFITESIMRPNEPLKIIINLP